MNANESSRTQPEEVKISVVKSALSTAFGTFLSRILGMVRDLVMTAYFDRTVTDVFYVAFRLPNMFRRLLGEGALAVSFLPVYVDLRDGAGKSDEHRKLAGMVWTTLLLITLFICTFSVIYMDTLLPFIVGGDGYASIAGKVELTVSLSQIMFFYLLFVTAYGFLSAIAQAHMRFFIPAFAAAVFNFILIVSVVVAKKMEAASPLILAWGVLIAGVFQMLMVVAQLMYIGQWPRLTWPSRSFKAFRKVILNMGPSVLGLGVLQIMGFANVYYASRLQEGTHSYIFLADRLLEFPQSLIAISIGTALLPALAHYFAQNDLVRARTELTRQMNLMLLMSIPSSLGLYFLSGPLVEVLYQRGAFKAHDAEVTAMITQFYAILLLTSGVNKILVTGFYAKKNTWTPAALSGSSVLFHLVFAHFATLNWGLKGLVLSTVLSSGLNVIGTVICSEIMVQRLDWKRVFLFLLRSTPAALSVYLMCAFGHPYLKAMLADFRSLVLAFTIMGSGIIYFALCWLFRVEEFQVLEARILRRLKVKT